LSSSNNSNVLFATKHEKRLFPCLLCPTSYHLTCIPPSAKFHELALLCHEHGDNHELPLLDKTTSFQCSVEAAVEKKLQQIQQQQHQESNLLLKNGKTSKNRRQAANKFGGRQNPFFPEGVEVDRRTVFEQRMLSQLTIAAKDSPAAAQENYEKTTMTAAATMELLRGPTRNNNSDQKGILFGLPAEFQGEVYSKPPVYKHINAKNDPNGFPVPKIFATVSIPVTITV
jgi:hypothetical protein